MENFDEKLKKIVTTGIGAVVSGVEKSRDAILEFAESDLAKDLSRKGEEVVRAAVETGSGIVKKVRDAVKEEDGKGKERRDIARLTDLAYVIHGLRPEQRAEVHRMVGELDEIKAKGEAKTGEDEISPEDAIGRDGVQESDFDLEAGQPADEPLTGASPTAPDDDLNVKRSQTNNMNGHLKQNVPPDF